jgi:transposase-like protein
MNKKIKMFSLVAQWRESGLSCKDFAKQNGISRTTFNYWCKKQSNEVVKVGDQPTFIELTSKADEPELVNCPKIELSLASGLVIKIY